MKRPDFIIAGATRSGVNPLTQLLGNHSQISFAESPQVSFLKQNPLPDAILDTCRFDFEEVARIQTTSYRLPEGKVIYGEKGFDPKQAHEGAPNAKIIFTLRDPISRAYAQFHHALDERKETVKIFEHAMEAELTGLRSPDTTGRCWLFKNQYQRHIEEWLKYYPKKKIFIMIYEEWTAMGDTSIPELESFLGLHPKSLSIDPNEKIIESLPKKYPALSDSTREELNDIFYLDKKFIADFIGRDIFSWNIRIKY